MPPSEHTKTIVAESTPPGVGGVSLIRIAGPDSLLYLTKITKGKKQNYKPRTVYHRSLWDSRGGLIDRALVTFFKKPNSYTGENIVEVSCHGSPLVVTKIISSLVSLGAVLAEPGEYTKRAFLNGKLNILQAEAVGEIISAKTEQALRLNLKILNENNPKDLTSIRSSLVLAASNIEHALDISDEDMGDGFFLNIIKSLSYAHVKMKKYIKNYKENRKHLHPPTVVLYGKPNVGKSTLFNAILNQDRAITNKKPGTTRDTIEQEVYIGGLCVVLVDTAGTRKTKNETEWEGVRRTEDAVLNSDLVLHVVESVDFIKLKGNKIVVYNKIDLIKNKKTKDNTDTLVHVSAKERIGIETLKEKIKTQLLGKKTKPSTSTITTARQLQAITSSAAYLNKALKILNNDNPELELVAFELRESIEALSVLLGKTSVEDIMKNVFNNFCVGK